MLRWFRSPQKDGGGGQDKEGRPTKAHLGEAQNKFYFDEKTKRWRVEGEEDGEREDEGPPSPPRMAAAAMASSSSSVGSAALGAPGGPLGFSTSGSEAAPPQPLKPPTRARARGIRSRYVDAFGGAQAPSGSATSIGTAGSGGSASIFPPAAPLGASLGSRGGPSIFVPGQGAAPEEESEVASPGAVEVPLQESVRSAPSLPEEGVDPQGEFATQEPGPHYHMAHGVAVPDTAAWRSESEWEEDGGGRNPPAGPAEGVPPSFGEDTQTGWEDPPIPMVPAGEEVFGRDGGESETAAATAMAAEEELVAPEAPSQQNGLEPPCWHSEGDASYDFPSSEAKDEIVPPLPCQQQQQQHRRETMSEKDEVGPEEGDATPGAMQASQNSSDLLPRQPSLDIFLGGSPAKAVDPVQARHSLSPTPEVSSADMTAGSARTGDPQLSLLVQDSRLLKGVLRGLVCENDVLRDRVRGLEAAEAEAKDREVEMKLRIRDLESDMNDLLVCLGQHDAKVTRLVEELSAVGCDGSAILSRVETEVAMAGGGRAEEEEAPPPPPSSSSSSLFEEGSVEVTSAVKEDAQWSEHSWGDGDWGQEGVGGNDDNEDDDDIFDCGEPTLRDNAKL